MRGLDGKIMIVAGGAGGIGAATSMRLAQEGAAVLVADLDGTDAERVVERIRNDGGRATASEFDISDEDSVNSVFESVLQTYNGLDGVHVNAADLVAIASDTDVVDIDLAVFDRTIAVNLRGHLLVARRAIPLLIERGGGALTYTSSGAAFAGGASVRRTPRRRPGCMRSFGTSHPVGANRGSGPMRWLPDSS
jgi:NAD(P)-dependent dehydrogenase (short-subunit alcohol dehydrogenase family)